jgi:hypothetical protein
VRREPNAANGNQSIVFDRGTHTFINRDGSGPDVRMRAPVPPASVMPKSGANGEIPRVTIPSTPPAQVPPNRVHLPPPYPVVPSTNGATAANGSQRPQTPARAPAAPQNPPSATSRPTAPSPAQPHPSAPRNTPGQLGSVPHSTAPGQQ